MIISYLINVAIITVVIMTSLFEKRTATSPLVGRGYSTDTQQIARNICFHSSVSSTSSQQSSVNLDTAIRYGELEKLIKFSVSAKGGFGMFSASAKADYLKSIEENSLTVSLNYLNTMQQKVYLSMSGYGIEALTDEAKLAYQEKGVNLFSLSCGDNYITSYSEGASLMVSLYLEFSDSHTRESFMAKSGGKFANIFSAMSTIETMAKYDLMSGKVSIKAYQEGGEPSRLPEILGRDAEGNYYVLSCDLNAMSNCKSAANSILDYARNSFPSQVSFTTGAGLTTFQDSLFEYSSIQFIGLSLPVSFVDGGESLNRLKFANDYVKYSSYNKQLSHLQSKYYSLIESDSDYKSSFLQTLNVVNDNLAKIAVEGLNCYNDPRSCKDVERVILPVEDNKLKLLDKTLENKYYSLGFQKLWTIPVQLDNQSNLVKSLVELNNLNNQNTLKLQSIAGDPTKYDQAELINFTPSQYSTPMEEIKYAPQVLNSYTQPGQLAYRVSDDRVTGWRSTDQGISELRIALAPGVSMSQYEVYPSDFHGNRVVSSLNSWQAVDGVTYYVRIDMSWSRGEAHYDKAMVAPVSAYYTPYYDPFIINKDDVIAVDFNHEVLCKASTICSAVIPFDKVTWNANSIKITSLPECGQLLYNDTTPVELNHEYSLDNEFLYQTPLDNANCEVGYIAISSDGRSSVSSIIEINTMYDEENTLAPVDSTKNSDNSNYNMIYGAAAVLMGTLIGGTVCYMKKKNANGGADQEYNDHNDGRELHNAAVMVNDNE